MRKSRNFRTRGRRGGFQSNRATSYENIEPKDASVPNAEKSVQTLISVKSMKNLPRSGSSYQPKLDPNTTVLPGSDPYSILNGLNRAIGGRYDGDDNLDGGNTYQFNTSEKSTFLHAFDAFRMDAKLKYRFLRIKPFEKNSKYFPGLGIEQEMARALGENISAANATTFTNLAAFTYYVTGNMPTGETGTGLTREIAGNPHALLTWATYYQIFWQNVSGTVAGFNKLRTNFGTMMRASWNREVSRLNAYFGLLQKKSFMQYLDSIGYSIQGEYFDIDWMRQANMLTALTSRRANALTEPILELTCCHEMPSLKLETKTGAEPSATWTTVFDSSKIDEIFYNAVLTGDQVDEQGHRSNDAYPHANMEEAMATFQKLFSIEDTLKWARQKESASNPLLNDTSRFNDINALLRALVSAINYFKPLMADFRTLLDVCGRVGSNTWSKTARPKVIRDTDIPMMRNLTLENLFSVGFSGNKRIVWNPTTYRWKGATLWNMYTGVPEYDSKSGGAFLSFSLKDVSAPADAAPDLAKTAFGYIPTIMSVGATVYAVNRLGTEVPIESKPGDTADNVTLNRLIVLPTYALEVQVPTATTALVEDASHLMSACLKVFGMCKINGDTACDPDLVAFVEFEIEDLSNTMITYARVNAPLRNTLSETTSMGFM